MKKVILVLACVAMFGLAACNGPKTCNCKSTVYSGKEEISSVEDKREIENGSCRDFNSEVSFGGLKTVVKCK